MVACDCVVPPHIYDRYAQLGIFMVKMIKIIRDPRQVQSHMKTNQKSYCISTAHVLLVSSIGLFTVLAAGTLTLSLSLSDDSGLSFSNLSNTEAVKGPVRSWRF